MTTAATRWWPLVALVGLVALGLAVGKGSTPLDDWFKHTGSANAYLGRLLFFTDGRVVAAVWAIVLVAALVRRRRRLAIVVAVTPLIAVAAARICKRLFGRYSDDQLAYPSGHTTLAVVVLGLAVLVVGVTTWSVVTAAVVAVLGMLGLGFTTTTSPTPSARCCSAPHWCAWRHRPPDLTGVNPAAICVTAAASMGS
jgi:hypothetical protein